eukprot:2378654-Amphidinium_carterae.1
MELEAQARTQADSTRSNRIICSTITCGCQAHRPALHDHPLEQDYASTQILEKHLSATSLGTLILRYQLEALAPNWAMTG